MVRERLARYRDRVRRELLAAFREEHTPHEIAASFAIGIFITAMPSGGLGIGLFFLFVYWWSWVSKTAIFASVLVLNPLIKPAVYLASYHVGAFIFGTEPVLTVNNVHLDTVLTIVQLILVGNLIIAIVLALASYVTVYHLTQAHRKRKEERNASSISTTMSLLFSRK
ncbi:DUF2062 domain-containing protein [Natronosalvus vescus]|uniref:DUF2062 domain-containing protein n=1 Tax=Natronosalvus vescus TaxID=2953881 RepID=UPI0020916A3A|nr:DUF2062 domain-containing protein [Natronosalvus vescus]